MHDYMHDYWPYYKPRYLFSSIFFQEEIKRRERLIKFLKITEKEVENGKMGKNGEKWVEISPKLHKISPKLHKMPESYFFKIG
jgi:hypothetical protein